ncbi:MAG: GAF domain-containing protein [Nitrospirae bacterium]|nr:GAF domain-containing protein [Nitrospirota bacterium]
MDIHSELPQFYSDVMQSLSAFQRIVAMLNKKSDVKTICDGVVKILSDELGLEHCSIMLLDDSGNYVVNQAGVSTTDTARNEDVFNRAFRVGEGVAGMVAKNNTPILISDVDNDARFMRLNSAVDIGSLLCLPVSAGGKGLGVLNLSHSKRKFFSKHHEKVFSILSTTVGHLINLVRLQKDLELLNKDLQITVLERTREIEESHEYLKNIFENASDIIFTIDNDGKFIFLNKRVEDLGYTKNELVGQLFDTLLMNERAIRAFVQVLKQGGKKTLEMDLKGKDGTVWQTLCSFAPLRSSSEGIVGLLGVAKDITEQKMLEKRLFQSEKLASLVTFVSGIAHELNNRLLPILVYSELLQQSPMAENELKLIKTVNRSATGARRIVESLLRFSRQDKPRKSPVNLNIIVQNVLTLLNYRISSAAISVRHEFDDTLPMIYADERQIEQVFVNIINNACDAIEEKGGTGGILEVKSYLINKEIGIDIVNNGPEIPGDVIGKIFDPFYTSKEVGKGTGLGLSLCYGIIREHGGDITVSSEAGKTRFALRLPITTSDDTANNVIEDSANDIACPANIRLKMVLVVDDEDDQLDVMRHILGDRYKVIGVNSGNEAIERLSTEDYDIVICDFKMPGTDGAGVYEWVSRNKPYMEKKMLFSTGDVLGGKVDALIKKIGGNYIIKPYNIEELLEKVEGIMNNDGC